MAQDPVKVDPKHYKVEFENDRVRVLRITYGPHEKSVMHSHPSGVAVFLTDSHGKFTYPDGKSVERDSKAGQVRWATGETHLPENLSDKPEELILVELKVKPATAKPVRMSSRLTLLVFKDNSISAVTDYWLKEGQLHYTTSSGEETAVPLERVDLEMTAYLNWQRGVKFVLRPKPVAG